VDSVHSTEETFTLDLPMELSIGAEWELNSKSGARWRAGVEWRQSRWSSVSNASLDPGVSWQDDIGFSAGASFTPRSMDDARNGFERMTYNVGYRQQSGYMLIDQGAIEAQSWSLGWSLPMQGSRSGSSINAAFTWTNTTAGDASPLLERGIGALFGFTLHPFFKNQWLVPRRYD